MLGIDDAISSVTNLASTIVTRIWPDATEIEKAKMSQALTEVQNEYNLILSQLKINEIEAGNSNLFVSGWRPALGWVCVLGFGYEYFFRAIFNAILVVLGLPPVFTSIAVEALSTLLFGMLGLTAARTVERVQNVARK
jgi:hypothetical protein